MATNATITLRNAMPGDAADMAILDDIAGDGISAFYWQQAVERGEAEHAFAYGRQRMMQRDEPFAWPNCRIAEIDDVVAGMLTGYLMPAFTAGAKWNEPVFRPMFELMEQIQGHWFIDALAVYPEYRRQGVARRLMADALARARAAGSGQVSLIATSDNDTAMDFYLTQGFVPLDERHFFHASGTRIEGKKHILMSRSL